MALACNIDNTLKEWAPLTDFFNKIPTKIQSGIFTQDLKLTCLDVLPEFLAVGTNVGIVYWYDRRKKDIQRLRCERKNVRVSAVKIISTVDFMVASGSEDGGINIFQIPKSHPDSIPDNLKPKGKQVERYTVYDLHKSPVTAIEWSKNGMKLFSGDKSGCIVLTELDFYMHICKSMEILNESYEVVQLSYIQRQLLISTIYRTIICYKENKWKVCQVGKKDRKVLGSFGGIIYQNGPKINDMVLYCARPGLRIWVSDHEGNVNKTLLFKDILKKETSEVPIINPISRHLRELKPQKEPSFGVVLTFNHNLILTYNNDVIYILDPEKMAVISTMSNFRSILSVATHKDEIFILEGERSIVRVSWKPEQNLDTDMSSASPVHSGFLPIKDIINKLHSSPIIPAISPFVENTVEIHTDETLIMNAEEATESPVKLSNSISDTEGKFDDIGKQQFNDRILFKKTRQRKKHKSVMSASMISLSSNSSEEKEGYIKPTLMTLSSGGVLPDLRSPESIQNDIEYKEKILADILSLDTVKISLDKLTESCDEETTREEQPSSSLYHPVGYDKISVDVEKPEEGVTQGNLVELSQTYVQDKAPACVNIPNEWRLSDIQVSVSNDTVVADNTLADWEIV